jgi:hypothetical protein
MPATRRRPREPRNTTTVKNVVTVNREVEMELLTKYLEISHPALSCLTNHKE